MLGLIPCGTTWALFNTDYTLSSMSKKVLFGILLAFTGCIDNDRSAGVESLAITSISDLKQKLLTSDTIALASRIRPFLAANANNSDSILNMCNFFLANNVRRYDLAKTTIVFLSPDAMNDVAYYMLSVIMESEDKLDSSIYYLNNAINLYPRTQYINKMILNVIQTGRVDSAIFLIDNFIRIAPNNANLRVIKGNALLQVKRYKEAVEEYNSAEGKNNIKEFYSSRAFAYEELGIFEKAKEDIEIAFQQNDTTFISYFTRASVNYHFYQYTNAMNDINNAIRLKADVASAFLLQALINKELKKYKEAIVALENMKNLDSADVRYFGAKARTLHQMENIPEAKRYYEIALQRGDISWQKFYEEMLREQ